MVSKDLYDKESCASILTGWILSFSFFPFIGKLFRPVCSTVPDCNKGAVVFHVSVFTLYTIFSINIG